MQHIHKFLAEVFDLGVSDPNTGIKSAFFSLQMSLMEIIHHRTLETTLFKGLSSSFQRHEFINALADKMC